MNFVRNFLQLATLIFAGIAAPAQDPRAESKSASAPDPYPAFVWRSGGPKAGAEWLKAITTLGFSGTNVEGSEDPAFIASLCSPLGASFYSDHLVDRAIFHRDNDDPVWTSSRERYKSSGSLDSLIRKPSLDSAIVLQQIREQAASRAAKATKHGARFLSITDEPSFTVGLCPIDYDYSEDSIVKFRKKLQTQFPSLRSLSELWNRPLANWGTVNLTTTNDIRAREWAHAGPWNFASWAAAREHADDTFANALDTAIRSAKTAAPNTKIGFLGALAPSAFGGYDWSQLLATKPGILEIYDAGAARDLVRTMAPEIELADTTFLTDSFSKYPPDLAAARLSWLFARGGRNAIIWANSALFENNNISKPTALAKSVGERVQQLRAIATECKESKPEFDSIGIVYSPASIRMGWLLDSRNDGNNWINRLTSYELEHSTALASLEGWFTICEDLGYSPQAVDSTSLVMRHDRLPRLLILPRCLALAGDEATAIARHAAAGGFIISEGRPALFNHLLIGGGPQSMLDLLFLLKPRPFVGFDDLRTFDPTAPPRGFVYLEPGLEGGEKETSGPILQNKNVSLVNVSMINYREHRLDAKSRDSLAMRSLLAPLLAASKVAQINQTITCEATSKPGLPISIHRERTENGVILFVTSNVRRRPSLARDAGPAVEVTLTIQGPAIKSAVRIDGGSVKIQNNDYGATLQFTLDPLHLACFRLYFN
ncbi:MAG: hypothetical protein ACKVS6_12545 [Planctomycetota bacterium]